MALAISEDRLLVRDLEEQDSEALLAELEARGEKLFFNGVNGTRGEFVTPPMTGAELKSYLHGDRPPDPEVRGELQLKLQAAFPIKPGNDPQDLAQAGWA